MRPDHTGRVIGGIMEHRTGRGLSGTQLASLASRCHGSPEQDGLGRNCEGKLNVIGLMNIQFG